MHDKIVQLMLSRFHIETQDGTIVERKDCEQVADEIISAFAEDGWALIDEKFITKLTLDAAQKFHLISDIEINPVPYMTGQEWYERFEKEVNNFSEDATDIDLDDIDHAAKRAAGIE